MVRVLSRSFTSDEPYGKCLLLSEPQLPYQLTWDNDLRSYCACVQNSLNVCFGGVGEYGEVPSIVPVVSASAQIRDVTPVVITSKLDKILNFHSSMQFAF